MNLSKSELKTIRQYEQQYPGLVELGRACVWVRNFGQGKGHDLAIDIAAELGLHLSEFYVDVPNSNGWRRLWGWRIQ